MVDIDTGAGEEEFAAAFDAAEVALSAYSAFVAVVEETVVEQGIAEAACSVSHEIEVADSPA